MHICTICIHTADKRSRMTMDVSGTYCMAGNFDRDVGLVRNLCDVGYIQRHSFAGSLRIIENRRPATFSEFTEASL